MDFHLCDALVHGRRLLYLVAAVDVRVSEWRWGCLLP